MISLRDVVKKQIQTNSLLKNFDDEDSDWGCFDVLCSIDIQQLKRRQLRKHLDARNEAITGTKRQMTKRLEMSIENERQRRIAESDEVEAQHQIKARLEQQGSIYGVGNDEFGQLGGGSNISTKSHFEIILRGVKPRQVSCGGAIILAVTDDHIVYTWGGSKDGAIPRIIDSVSEEEIVCTAVGSSYATGISIGGDCFIWGRMGVETVVKEPVLFDQFNETDQIIAISSGEKHLCAITKEGSLRSWGYGADGRLGAGKQMDSEYFPSPLLIKIPNNEKIESVSCGAIHALAISQNSSRVYSWGSGAGGRLGHDTLTNRYSPEPVVALDGWNCISVSAGTWHSACVARRPPLKSGGFVFTWGSGFQGQLGQDKTTISAKPKIVEYFRTMHMLAKEVVCGSHHNAVITSGGELYTWGSNSNGCLGRSVKENRGIFTPEPGHCIGFGSVVDRIARGLPRSVCCGKGYTIVATHPYDEPNTKGSS